MTFHRGSNARRSGRCGGSCGRGKGPAGRIATGLAFVLVTGIPGCTRSLPGLPFPWRTEVFGEHRLVGLLDSREVPESSGVAAGSRRQGVYWTHNDSGPPRVYALSLEPDEEPARVRLLGHVELAGARNRDWEDMAAGPGGTLYILDGGDNPPCDRSDKCVYRIVEPSVEDAESLRAVRWERLRFEYPAAGDPDRPADRPEDRFDAETLLVHPVSGDLYILTKRDTRDRGVARVFRLSAAEMRWDGRTVHVLRPVCDLTRVLGVGAATLTTVTGGEIDPSGRRMVLRRYFSAYEFTLPAGVPFEEIFRQVPLEVPLPGELQGEGICYAHDGRSLVTTSEVVRFGPATCPVFLTPWEAGNVRVEVRRDRAAVRWDTRRPADCRVTCRAASVAGEREVQAGGEGVSGVPGAGAGPATPESAECRVMCVPEPATRHAAGLAGLRPGTPYVFSITCGSWTLDRDAARRPLGFTTPD